MLFSIFVVLLSYLTDFTLPIFQPPDVSFRASLLLKKDAFLLFNYINVCFIIFFIVKELCVALFPYDAVNSDELTLVEGDIVTILSREVEDKGWWKGELKGKIGVFPDNFVQLLNQDEVIFSYV